MTTPTQSSQQKWLDDVRTTLTNDFEVQTVRLTQLTADTGDPGEAHTQSALIAATRQSIDQITGALHRITDGRYGSCEKCGAPISRERLEVLPHARYCMPCQQKQH